MPPFNEVVGIGGLSPGGSVATVAGTDLKPRGVMLLVFGFAERPFDEDAFMILIETAIT